VCISACSISHKSKESLNASKHPDTQLIYLNEARLNLAKQAIQGNNPVYTTAYTSLIQQADNELKKKIDPVTNKTVMSAKNRPWQQIIGGGATPQLKNLALPMFSRTELMLEESILPENLKGYDKFSAQDILTYAPQY
jgi:hypothetical protein